jgi:hypothetical protein
VQAVHVEAPEAARVLVKEPASQVAQADVEAAEYLPAVQAVHVVAPEAARVLVKEPASQVAQADVEAAE